MKFESLERANEKISYSENLEKTLEIGDVANELEKEFDIFLQNNKFDLKNELGALRAIKLFIYREEEKVRAITSQSVLSGFDCLTLSIITCLIANRKGYNVKIGRPDKISRYFHSLIIKQDGEMFKIAGRNRNYPVKEMKVDEVIARLKSFSPVINAVDAAKKYLKNL